MALKAILTSKFTLPLELLLFSERIVIYHMLFERTNFYSVQKKKIQIPKAKVFNLFRILENE